MRQRNGYSISSNDHRAAIVIWSITCIGVVANHQAVRELFITLFIICERSRRRRYFDFSDSSHNEEVILAKDMGYLSEVWFWHQQLDPRLWSTSVTMVHSVTYLLLRVVYYSESISSSLFLLVDWWRHPTIVNNEYELRALIIYTVQCYTDTHIIKSFQSPAPDSYVSRPQSIVGISHIHSALV